MVKHTYYIHIWTTALTQFGWPTARIDKFVFTWMNYINNNDESFFYHDPPSYYLTWEILSEQAVREIDAKGHPEKLFTPVQRILDHHLKTYESLISHQPPQNPDWQQVKKEIELFLAENGESLRYP